MKSGTLSYNSFSCDIKNNQIYTFEIRAYMTYNGQKYYTNWTKINCFEQAWMKSLSKSNGKLNIKWNKVAGATGYDIYVSMNQKNGYKKVKSVGKNTTSFTLKKLAGKKISSKKTYYVYVVTKKKSSGKTDTSGVLYTWTTRDKGRNFNYVF